MIMLAPRDIKVLIAINWGLKAPKEIADRIRIPVESVISSAEALSEEKLIEIEKNTEETYYLTSEGLHYVKEGLPERKLLEDIKNNHHVSEIKDPSAKLGLGWLKKKGWAAIDHGIIKPTGFAPIGEDEKALESILNNRNDVWKFYENAITILKSRGLVGSKINKSWKYEITNKGKNELLTNPYVNTYLKELQENISITSNLEKQPQLPTERTASITTSAIIVNGVINQIASEHIKNGRWGGEGLGDNYVWVDNNLYYVRPYDLKQSADKSYPGKRHPYQRIIDFMREIMLEMGFVEIKGQIVQSSFWNFDALFQPQDHPAREMQDTFYLDSRAEIPDYTRVKEMHECGRGAESTGWGGVWRPEVACQEVLRTHTTGVTIKYLAEHPQPPVKAFGIDRVYRREAIDATHTPEFEQLEGIVMDRDVTFCHLLGILKEFYAKMGFEEVRFRPGYFPYTEPSVEPEVFIDGLGWVELGGAGVFRKEVTAPFGIEHPVLAWGLGVSRVAMLRLGLKDLRLLYQSDLEWLRQTPVSIKL